MRTPKAPSSAMQTELEFAHHFASRAQQVETDLFGMWVFLATEVMFFGGAFAVYGIYRYANGEAFALASNHLDLVLGTINTLVLLTSSLTMALTVLNVQQDRRKPAIGYLALTMMLGLSFVTIKGIEYHHKFEQGLWPIGNALFRFTGDLAGGVHLFYSLYFALTGLHALHMLIGIALLAWFLWILIRKSEVPLLGSRIEVMGLYWHFVDVVWIFLFPMLYLVNRTQ
jgi:cytochrome c oxidase subunit 3